MNDGDTIFALATAPGRSGIAVVRISGSSAGPALAALAGRLPPARIARLARFRDPGTGETIDRGLALFFPGPASVTGEDVAELHVHGSRAVAAALLEVLAVLPGLRPAEPGEFTRRGFHNGKLDLTAAEGLVDLIAAETSAQRRQALRQLDGALGRLYENWRSRLLGAQARLEAAIDFPEEDLPPQLWTETRSIVAALAGEIAAHLADGRRGERLRDGVTIAIVGPPNAGKSSLLNALAKRDVAITSAIAGTTRDVIEVALDVAGYPVILADTAGLREAGDAIEEEGVRRARARAEAANLKLVVLDATRPEEASGLEELVDENAVVVANKIDLLRQPWREESIARRAEAVFPVSVRTGEGMEALLEGLGAAVAKRLSPGDAPLITRARHRSALEECRSALERVPDAALPELAAEDLRTATRALGRITGRVDVEDMLDLLFGEFCIGK